MKKGGERKMAIKDENTDSYYQKLKSMLSEMERLPKKEDFISAYNKAASDLYSERKAEREKAEKTGELRSQAAKSLVNYLTHLGYKLEYVGETPIAHYEEYLKNSYENDSWRTLNNFFSSLL